MAEIPSNVAQYSCKIAGQTFQVLGFQGYEEISQLFRFSLTLWSDDPAVDIAALIRKTADDQGHLGRARRRSTSASCRR